MPDDTDPLSGLPDDLGIGEDLARTESTLRIRTETRRYGKPVTIVEGFDPGAVDLSDLASELKSGLGTGGTVDGDAIELQGDHADRVVDLLEARGFRVA